MYTWVGQSVRAVENQVPHADWHQWSQHTQGVVAPDLVAADEQVFLVQLGT